MEGKRQISGGKKDNERRESAEGLDGWTDGEG